MLDPTAIKRRMIEAIDSYPNYAPSIKKVSDGVYMIQKIETYIVNMNTRSCNCGDNTYRGYETLCKHYWIIVIYDYFIHRENRQAIDFEMRNLTKLDFSTNGI